ncbi:hypothetical protein [Bacillus sp. AK128]
MVNQFLKATEEWLCSELRLSEPSFIWAQAEQRVIDEIHDVKRWFDYLKEMDVIPQYFRIEAFTIPRLDSFEGDDILVVYKEGSLWTGYPLSRFTAFTNKWNKQGLIEFSQTLFPSKFVEQTLDQDKILTENNHSDFTSLGGWGSINAEISDVEIEDYYIEEDLFNNEDEETSNDKKIEAYSVVGDESFEDDFDDDEFDGDFTEIELEDSEFDEDIDVKNETNHESENHVDTVYVSQLLEGINGKLNTSISTVEECVQEAIDLAAQKKGSKKLVRLILEVEEELIELKDQLTNSTDSDEE